MILRILILPYRQEKRRRKKNDNFTAQKIKFSIKDFVSKCADLVTFAEEIVNEKLHFLCSKLRHSGFKHSPENL